MGRPAWMEQPTGSRESWRPGLFAVAAEPAQAERSKHRSAAARCFQRSLLSPKRRVWERYLDDHAVAAQQIDQVALGSELRGPELDQRQGAIDRAIEDLGEH